jgi:hypothetical protein
MARPLPFLSQQRRSPGEERTVLRITTIRLNGAAVTLKLEGKIHADWGLLLKQECQALIRQRKQVALDFAKVLYVDVQGIEVVQHLRSKGIAIINPPDFIAALLDRGGKP